MSSLAGRAVEFHDAALVELQARFHAGDLLGRRLALVAGFPFAHRHAVDQLARRVLVARVASLANPVGQAIAAEAGKAHQVDVLRIVAVAQVAHQLAESGRGHGVGQLVERIGGHGILVLVMSPASAIGGRP